MGASRARPSVAANPAERELVITRVFDAQREIVFRAWIEPEQASQWMGPQGFTVVSFEMDVRPGGAWRKCMRSPEGRDYWRKGVYREIVAPERLGFTYVSDDPIGIPGHETLVTVSFSEQRGKTLMTLRPTEFESMAASDFRRSYLYSAIATF